MAETSTSLNDFVVFLGHSKQMPVQWSTIRKDRFFPDFSILYFTNKPITGRYIA
jgi:hypothetical protein